MLQYSCSNEIATNENDNLQRNIIEISSMEEFYEILKNLNVPDGFDLSSVAPDSGIHTKVSSGEMMTTGYKTYTAYSNTTDLTVRVSDFQVADKLGLKANTLYYFTAYQVRQEVLLNSNNKPSPMDSPNCGLLPGVNLNDLNNIVNRQRGYQATYLSSQNKFDLVTTIVSFKLSKTTNTLIWFPTAPAKLEWNYKVFIL